MIFYSFVLCISINLIYLKVAKRISSFEKHKLFLFLKIFGRITICETSLTKFFNTYDKVIKRN